MPSLTLKFKDNVIGRFPLPKGKSLTIGRRKDNDIVIDNLAVSGHHAKVDAVGDAFVLVDLQSKNGSFVNEQIVSTHWLREGDVISIGKHLLAFSTEDKAGGVDAQAPEIDKTMIMDTSSYRSMVQKSAPPLPKPLLRQGETNGCLTYVAGGSGKVELGAALVRIGKDPSSDVVLKGWRAGWASATVSRRPDGFHLSNAGGWSKPRVNGRPVPKSVLLQDLDVIEVGPVKLQFFLGEPAAAK
ncbi:MAG TPA: FHA domain-containing protein [Desulfobacterales bacterium]|nr:FHA domain-containing protein [Desulfobacterales bacterium]